LRRIKHGTEDLREFKTKPFSMFEKPQQEPLHKEKKCSDCDSRQAWFSENSGKTWQCEEHKKW
jgi:hypothetical protein